MDSSFFFEQTTYWSEGDEQAHFSWLAHISSIRSVKGVGSRLYLEIDTGALSAEDLRELNAVYRRYEGDISQLAGLNK